MLHILFSTAWYPNRLDFGNGVFVEKHAKAIAMHHKVSVLLVKADPSVNRGYDMEVEKDGNLNIYKIYVPKVKIEISVLTPLLRFIYYLRGSIIGYKRIRKDIGKIDISHVNPLTRAGLIPFLLKKIYNIPYIITEHWPRYGQKDYKPGIIHSTLTKTITKNAAFVTPVSKNLQDAMVSRGLINDNYTIVNNVVNTDIFSCKNDNNRINEKIIISHVSWMRNHAKNITGILNAIKRISALRQDFVLNLIGEGDDKDLISKRVKELNLEDFVSFPGAKQGAELADYLKQSNFFILFSNYENQPVCVLEALSCGTPVIATNVGAINEMIGKERGIIIEKCDEEALFVSILDMMENYSKYDNKELHRYINDNYSPKVICKNFEELYYNALNK